MTACHYCHCQPHCEGGRECRKSRPVGPHLPACCCILALNYKLTFSRRRRRYTCTCCVLLLSCPGLLTIVDGLHIAINSDSLAVTCLAIMKVNLTANKVFRDGTITSTHAAQAGPTLLSVGLPFYSH